MRPEAPARARRRPRTSSPRSRPARCSATSSARRPAASCTPPGARRLEAVTGRRWRPRRRRVRRSATASSCSARVHRFGGGDRRRWPTRSATATPTRRSRSSPRPDGVRWIVEDHPRRASRATSSRRCASAPSTPAAAVLDAARAGEAPSGAGGARRLPRAVRAPARPVRRRRRGPLRDRGLAGERRRPASTPTAAGTSGARCWSPQRLRALRLFNGDTGVVVAAAPAGAVAAFERRRRGPRGRPLGLAAVDTVYAMTIHKSQGSQFERGGGRAAAGRRRPSSPASCSTPR